MRLGLVFPVFSGLQDSLVKGCWQPTGAPAIYKLLEALARTESISTEIIFQPKNPEFRQEFPTKRIVHLAEIGDVLVLAAPRSRGRLTRLWTEAWQAVQSLLYLATKRVDAIYASNGALPTAGLAARIMRRPTILRIMGVFPFHRKLPHAVGISAKFSRAMFRSPFSCVLVTHDGSGGEDILRPLIMDGVQIIGSLNGVDQILQSQCVERLHGSPYVIFAGRLVQYKGANEFVSVALEILQGQTDCGFDFIILGDGPERDPLERRVRDAGLSKRIRFLGAVSHNMVASWLYNSEIYVSLNKNGDLSNVNLEALSAGCCLLFANPEHLPSQAETNVIPSWAVQRCDFEEASLLKALIDLMGSPEKRAKMKSDARRVADDKLLGWDQRIAWEINLIEDLVQRENGKSNSSAYSSKQTTP